MIAGKTFWVWSLLDSVFNSLTPNDIQVSNLHGFRCRFWLCPTIYILKINEKIAVGTGTYFQRQEVSGNKVNTSLTQCKQRLAHKTSQPHPTAANQIVPKFFLDPHLTKWRWGTPLRGISTLCGHPQRRQKQLVNVLPYAVVYEYFG